MIHQGILMDLVKKYCVLRLSFCSLRNAFCVMVFCVLR